jgi:hypothetical protein
MHCRTLRMAFDFVHEYGAHCGAARAGWASGWVLRSPLRLVAFRDEDATTYIAIKRAATSKFCPVASIENSMV